jgi:hypothetical protein
MQNKYVEPVVFGRLHKRDLVLFPRGVKALICDAEIRGEVVETVGWSWWNL